MRKVLIVFAQQSEAAATLKCLKAEPVEGMMAQVWSEGHIPSLYRFEQGWIAISSVGLHAAQMSVARHAHLCDEVWNAGLAGALRDHPIGALLSVAKVGKYIGVPHATLDPRSQQCLENTLPHLAVEGTEARLISSDFPIHDLSHKTSLSHHWDLVDMEGYGIAYAAAQLKKPCRMWKIVSDFASPGGRELIRTHKQTLSHQLADLISHQLNLNF